MGYRPLSFGIFNMEGRFSDIRFDSTVFAECFPAKSFIFFHSSTCFPYSVKLRNSEWLVVKECFALIFGNIEDTKIVFTILERLLSMFFGLKKPSEYPVN